MPSIYPLWARLPAAMPQLSLGGVEENDDYKLWRHKVRAHLTIIQLQLGRWPIKWFFSVSFFLFFPLYFASKHIYCLYRQNVAVTGATAAAVGVATKVAATLALLLLEQLPWPTIQNTWITVAQTKEFLSAVWCIHWKKSKKVWFCNIKTTYPLRKDVLNFKKMYPNFI